MRKQNNFWFLSIFILIALLLLFVTQKSGMAGLPNATQSTDFVPISAPSLWVSPLELDFGPVGVGDTSPTLTVTIHNSGNDTLGGFAGGGVNPPFNGTQNCASGVPPGGSCQYFFTFSPTATGVFTATSSSGTNAGPFSIKLRGTGVGAGLHVTPLSLDFGYVWEDTTSEQQIVTIRNTGLSTLNFAGGGVNPPFYGTQNCAAGVPPGGSCQYFFTFSPTDTGFFTETSDSATNAGPFSIDLQGRGRSSYLVGGQRVTPRSLDFGPVGVGLTSPTLLITITNQSIFFPITDWAGGGVYPPFGGAQDCAGGLSPGESCNFYYTFTPTAEGVFTATSSVSNSFGDFSIELKGTGVGGKAHASQLVLDFGPVALGDTSPTQTVLIKNTGMARLEHWAGGGVLSPFTGTQDCAGGLDPGETCQFYYTFSPTEYGRFSATSSVSTDGGSFSILLYGGTDLPQAEMEFSPSTIAPGGTSTLEISISNPNRSLTLFGVGFTDNFPPGLEVASPLIYSVSPECGTPTFAPTVGATSLSFSEGTLKGGKTCVVSVNVTAGAKGKYTNSIPEVTTTTGNSSPAMATLQVGFDVYLPYIKR